MSELWKREAVELMLTSDISWRAISRAVGKPKSTVSDYLRKYKRDPKFLEEVVTKGNTPKILLYDLETSLIKGYFWGLFKQNIPIGAIEEDWYIICWSAKWLGQDEIINASVHNKFEEDYTGRYRFNERYLVEKLWALIDQADVVIAYNGKKFDKKKMNAKFLEYGLPEPSPYKIVDPYLIVKGNFSLTSGKMDYVAKYISDIEEGKLKTNLKLWLDCMKDDEDALDRMQDYCDGDIGVLERVYLAIRHWDKNSPNLAVHYDDEKPRCNSCGSDDLELLPNKSAQTNLSKFEVHRCNNCRKILRGRENLLSKHKRASLMMNVT